MENEEIRSVIERQKRFFATGATLDISYRLEMLKKLRLIIIDHEQDIVDAIWKDFHKPEFEVIATETRFVIKELNYAIKHLRSWSRSGRVRTPIVHFMSHSYVKPQPYGQVLVLSPWNFPFQLAFMPLIGALAAGNCVILKVSRQAACIADVMEHIISHFPPELMAMINGGHSVSDYLLDQKFDYIFFTGSCRVGKLVMKKAAENLIPVSLELGGKNPCVITADARLDFAARRIAWGKFLNAGQTCVCPDYVLIDKKIRDKFLELITKEILSFYGENPEISNDFARLINPDTAKRLAELMKGGNIVTGGVTNIEKSYISPTVVRDVRPEDPLMQDEIFGPVLPVVDFEDFEEVYEIIEKNPKPLATYIFSRNRKLIRTFLSRTQAGTASVNDTVMQIASPYLPYGGVGSSGIGRYHGKRSFDTFSNHRSVLVKSNLFDLPLRYPPYSDIKTRIASFFLR
ncbi:MAG: aldehyde dehydrogenase [Bacteroidales bacterium]|nr:aldehyde dehydrogenase [Bacteroidales bacterium]